VATSAALAVLCGYAGGLLAVEITAGAPRDRALAGVVVAVVHGASVGLGWVAPRGMLGLLLLTAVAYAALGFPVALLGPAALVAMYTVAGRLRRRDALTALVVVELVLAVLLVLGPGNHDLGSLALYAGLVGGAWLLGDVSRRWRILAEENGRRAAELERARTELAAQAVALERLRIARELHDVVAHSVSVVAMHAGAGRLAVETDPVAARSALLVIERTTRDTLAEMRRLVTVLREDSSVDGASPFAPTPGLGDLPALVAGMAAAGLVVDVRTEGDLTAVSPGASLAGYRVVQEALTNVLRHAGTARVRVDVQAAGGLLDVTVENGPGDRREHPARDQGGHGLRGMRERLDLYSGTLVAGPTASGGWRVAARLPYAGAGA
jgi:signal transduction histidine kinase